MALINKWYWFEWSIGRYWSVGCSEFGVHLQTPLFAICRSGGEYPLHGWNFGFWPAFPKPQGMGGNLYRWNCDMRYGSDY